MVIGGHRARGIGASTVIIPGVELGDNCIIGAGAVVTGNVGARCIAAGNPATGTRKIST